MKVPALCIVLLLNSTAAFAQPGAQSDTGAPLAPGEIQKLLDGYAIIQAQESLGMTDAQFGSFLPKLRALQDVRRRNEQERLRLLQELRRMTNGRAGQIPENEIRDRVRALKELETRSVTDIQKAYEAIDQTLDVRQQARFRIFEQEIEQRKLQLLMRARQGNPNRANRPNAVQP
jgi:hypothetical protein